MGANVVGISFHVGSGCTSPVPFSKAVEAARRAFDMFEPCGLPKPKFLDLGGGWPGALMGRHDKGFATFEDIAALLRPTLDRCFPESEGVTIVAEPGRYFAHSSTTLYTCVNARRAVYPEIPDLAQADSTRDGSSNDASSNSGDGNDAVAPNPAATPAPASPTHRVGSGAQGSPQGNVPKGFRLYINSGLYHEFNCILYDHREGLEPSGVYLNSQGKVFNPSGPLLDCSVWGPTCDGIDRISASLPTPELRVGDWIEWRDMGAYCRSACTSFNGFPPAETLYVDSSRP